MKQIGNVIISDEVWQMRFSCDLNSCHGNCCKYGDLGAPISLDEEKSIENNLSRLSPYLQTSNLDFLKDGVSEEYNNSLHIREIEPNTPCPLAYISENQTILCSLHSLALDTKTPLLKVKPFWCSLFPLIIKPQGGNWTINCHIPKFCRSLPDAPPLILSFANILVDFFGEDWIDAVKAEYALDEEIDP